MHFHGNGVAQDRKAAARFFRKGCKKGNGLGCTSLALMLRDGAGIKQNMARAQELLRKACDGGTEKACAALKEIQNRQDASKQAW
jgi:uncharacterized protein